MNDIKKLAVFVMIAGLTMFMAVATASAKEPQGRHSIQGQYYFIGAGPCVLGLTGFNEALQPNSPATNAGPWSMSDSTWEGVYSFNHDGTGTFKGIYRVVERPSDIWPLSPNPTGNDIPYATAANVSWNFKYTLSKTGRITFTYSKGSYLLEWLYGPGAGTELYL